MWVQVSDFYRPQRSCEGYVFTPVCQSFCSQGGVPGQVHPRAGTPPWDQAHPPGPGTPPWQVPPGQVHPLGRYTPGRYTPGQIHPQQVHPPRTRYTSRAGTLPLGPGTPPRQVPPPPQADGCCCGRYASYWNAFLFYKYYLVEFT